jgi:prepilin-type N-terminal cleavage/methylation domain-containing protein
MCRTYLRDRHGFTLVELMISLAIIGILVATTAPLANTYRLKAKNLELHTTARYLMDSIESRYIESNELFPDAKPGFFSYTEFIVTPGKETAIPQLSYTFPSSNNYTYKFTRMKYKLPFLKIDWDYAWIVIDTDFDYNRDGKNDTYTIHMQMENNKPKEGFYREFIPNPF